MLLLHYFRLIWLLQKSLFVHRERLENPYYYYGSTRNQKKAKMIAAQQKPRPLLPSQRAALELQQRAPAFMSNQLPGERPK